MKKKKWGWLLAAALLAALPQAVEAVEAENLSLKEPVVQMEFEGDLADGTGNGHDGTASTDVVYVEGVDGQALYLDGKTYVDLGTDSALQPENLTVSMWVRAEGTMSGEEMLVWFKPNGNYQGKGWYLSCLDDNTPLKISIGESTGQPMEAYVSGSRSEFFPDGEWVHIAVTFDSETREVAIYRNGIAQDVLYLNSTSVITSSDTDHKYLGFNSPGYNSGYAKVSLDDFRIYGTTAQAEDVIQLYTMYGAVFDTGAVLQADASNLKLSIDTAKYDITLPDCGSAGSTITWASSDEAVLSPDGTVTRPALGEADAVVTLTATLTFEGESMEKEFQVTVPAVTDFTGLSDFSTADVELTDAYLVNAGELEITYLKELDVDRLLAGFAELANKSTGAEVYGGWEDTEIKGHTLGHYLTAVSQAYEATGDEELGAILDHAIDCLATYQQGDGYVAAIPKSDYEKLEQGNTTGTWVPWYTMHKVLAGIIDVYQVTGNEKALTVASKLGDWVYSRTSTWTEEVQQRVLSVEYGGMNDCLYELYSITGSEKHLQAAHAFDETELFDSLYNGEDVLNGLHANTTIPKIVGALNRYLVLGEEEDGDYYLRVAENFWDIVVNHHTYITGGNSEWEHFGAADVLDAERTNCNCETCNTYNMLKLTRELYKITGDAKYADYYENTFINAILSSQNPETGMTTYFQPMATGYYKVYSTEFNSFWCCTGSGMENFTKLGDSLYYHNDNDIYVMQFFSSSVTWTDKNLTLTQETSIPEEDTITLTVHTIDGGTTDAGIRIRVPDWLSGDASVQINGQAQEVVVAGGMIFLGDSWKDGDVITVTYPMTVVAYGLPDDENVVAFKYGPIVLSASLGTEDMQNSTTGVNVTVPTKTVSVDEKIRVTEGSIADWLAQASTNVVRDGDALRFTLNGTDSELVFTAHYMQYTDRYGIYFYLTDTEDTDLEDTDNGYTLVDSVPVSNDQYELAHNLTSEQSSTGSFGGRMYRDASQGGYFAYTMKVETGAQNILSVTYAGADAGRTFSIYADDELLADVTLAAGEDDFYTVEYVIPDEMTAGKESVTIRFAADRSGYAGGIFDRMNMYCVSTDSDAAAEDALDVDEAAGNAGAEADTAVEETHAKKSSRLPLAVGIAGVLACIAVVVIKTRKK